MLSTDQDWEKWGAKDPYYGVVSRSEFRACSFVENRDRFFNSGEEFIDKVFAQAKRCFGGIKKGGTGLDFGCGVGRLTIPLARRLGHVDGLDVAPGMLKLARENCKVAGRGNVEFYQSNGMFDSERWPRRYDYINSYIVLQHIPVRRGYTIIDRLLGLLNDDGIAMLHVSLRRNLPLWRSAVYRMKHSIPLASYAFNVLQNKPLRTPQMQMNEYDIVRVMEIFSRHKITEVSVTPENHRGVETAQLIGRKER
jgi:cyclopropane fatty-acyl-phospholipid synthase-like methyltransferase